AIQTTRYIAGKSVFAFGPAGSVADDAVERIAERGMGGKNRGQCAADVQQRVEFSTGAVGGGQHDIWNGSAVAAVHDESRKYAGTFGNRQLSGRAGEIFGT